MKKTAWLVLCVLATVAPAAQARPRSRALEGALVGTALGLLVGHHIDGVDTDVAVPVLGLAGAIIGHGAHYGRRSHGPYFGYHSGCRVPTRYGYDRYGPRHYRSSYRSPWYRPVSRASYGYGYPPAFTTTYATPVRRAPARQPVIMAPPRPQQPVTNRHPGVTLHKVSLVDDRGIAREIRILQTSRGYVGPRGEHYGELPTSALLASRYGQTRNAAYAIAGDVQ